jgi:hypothetical protein
MRTGSTSSTSRTAALWWPSSTGPGAGRTRRSWKSMRTRWSSRPKKCRWSHPCRCPAVPRWPTMGSMARTSATPCTHAAPAMAPSWRLHIGRRVLELARLRPAGPGRTAPAPGRRTARRPVPSRLTSACSGLISRIGCALGRDPGPACLSMRARCAHVAFVDHDAGRRVDQARGRAHVLGPVLQRGLQPLEQGLEGLGGGLGCFFSSSSCSLPRSTAPLATLCSACPRTRRGGQHPLVDAVDQQQHLDALLAEDLELRAVLGRGQLSAVM